MTRFIESYVSPQMLALWLLEFALSFCLACILLDTGSTPINLPSLAAHALVLALTVVTMAYVAGLYRPEVFRRTREMLINTALGAVLAFPAAWLVSRAIGMDMDRIVGHDTFWPTKIVLAWVAAVFVTRLLFLAMVRSNLFVRRVAVLGPHGAMAATVAAIGNERQGFLEVVSVPIAALGPAGLRAAGVRDAVLPQSAFVAMPVGEQAGYAAVGVLLETETGFWERHLKRVDIVHVDGTWVAGLGPVKVDMATKCVNRIGDVGISLTLLMLTLPLMLVTALLVCLESAGPILYRQERVGLGGRPFTLLKFRSMQVDAEARGPAWATQGDPRVTRVGAFIRRSRIDELPQLINILQGEMSFIGPRPERPHFVEQLAELIPYYAERARVRPGLTGWAQVNFRYGACLCSTRVGNGLSA